MATTTAAMNNRIRLARGGHSQTDIAKACGITRAYYSRIENGQRIPSLAVAQKIARELGSTVDYLFPGLSSSPAEE